LEISVDQIKTLRELTGAGIMDCKKALQEAEGNLPKAQQILRAKGIAKAADKVGRETREGLVEAYIHSGSRIGALVEVNCETDFVSRLPEFKELAHQLAMQVVAMTPQYVDRSQMPVEDSRDPDEVCLLQQPYIKDNARVIQDLVTDLSARVGEHILVRRFARFALGE